MEESGDIQASGESKPSESRVGMEARILTWNINGLRKVAASHGGFKPLLDQFQADIVAFQEIKITRAGLVEHDLARAQGYHCFFTHCKVKRKPSYSGVATFVRAESGLRTLACTTSLRDAQFFGSPGSITGALGSDRLVEIDAEGRVLVTDHGHFMLFNVYAPCISSSEEDEKTDERRMFKRDFLALLQSRISEAQDKGRNVILVGDLNSCASQMDHGYAISDSVFFGSQWSKWIRGMLGLSQKSRDTPENSPSDPPRLVDCFRRLHPDRKNAFTCWNTQTGARENNYGTRIDYIIANTAFADRALRGSDIMPDFLGSDHCPVRADFVVYSQGPGPRSGGLPEADWNVANARAYDWPEHSPECSCFYRELTGKQEKLAKYFAAGNNHEETEGSHYSEEGGAGKRPFVGRASTAPIFGATRTISSGGSGTWPSSQKLQGASTGVVGRSSSIGIARRGRTVGSSGVRQSKLMFASNRQDAEPRMTTARSSTKSLTSRGKTTTASEAEADNSGLEALKRGGVYQDDDRGLNLRTLVSPRANVEDDISSGHAGGQRGSTQAGTGAGDVTSSDSLKGSVGDEAKGEGDNGSAEAWKAIFGRKKDAPLCEHGEPSIQRTVIKQGANHNRRFYTCARAAGNWPTDRNARCNFFQWRMDGVRGYKDRPPREDNGKKQRRG